MKITTAMIVSNTKREQLQFDWLKYIYIPLTLEEISFLGLDPTNNPCFRITVEDK